MQTKKPRFSLAEVANRTRVVADIQRERTANTERLRVLTAEIALLPSTDPARAEKIAENNRLATRQVELKESISDVATIIERERVALEAEVERLSRETTLLSERISVGALRREEMVKVLTVLVAAEDNAAISDEEYDTRIEACVKRARTLLSLEAAGT